MSNHKPNLERKMFFQKKVFEGLYLFICIKRLLFTSETLLPTPFSFCSLNMDLVVPSDLVLITMFAINGYKI